MPPKNIFSASKRRFLFLSPFHGQESLILMPCDLSVLSDRKNEPCQCPFGRRLSTAIRTTLSELLLPHEGTFTVVHTFFFIKKVHLKFVKLKNQNDDNNNKSTINKKSFHLFKRKTLFVVYSTLHFRIPFFQ